MSDFNRQIYDQLKLKFLNATKCVLKEKLSKNPDTLKSYENSIVTSFNELASFIDDQFRDFDDSTQIYFRQEFLKFREKLLRSFGKLDCNIHVPSDLFQTIDINNTEQFENASDALSMSVEVNNIENNTSNIENGTNSSDDESIVKMPPVSKLDLLRSLSQTINQSYSGDPLALDAFIDRIELAKCALEGDEQLETLRKFVLTKLEGKARELVDTKDTLDEITKALRANIKPDSSKVIEGRMLSLRLNKIPSTDYAIKAEELAEALQRSLIVEGITREKAKQMAIEKTVEMCRQSARTDLVKSVIASTSFKEPKEVIAKLITEQTVHEKEQQILSFHRYDNRNRNNGWRGGRNNYRGNFQNSNRGGFSGQNGNWNNKSRGNVQGNNYRNNNRKNYDVRVTENWNGPSEDGQTENQEQPTFTIEQNEDN